MSNMPRFAVPGMSFRLQGELMIAGASGFMGAVLYQMAEHTGRDDLGYGSVAGVLAAVVALVAGASRRPGRQRCDSEGRRAGLLLAAGWLAAAVLLLGISLGFALCALIFSAIAAISSRFLVRVDGLDNTPAGFGEGEQSPASWLRAQRTTAHPRRNRW